MAKSILVIDDDIEVANMISTVLTVNGFDAVAAYSGKSGLAQAKADPPDAIVLDLLLPDLSGHEVLRRLKEDAETREIPVLMLTAVGDIYDVADSVELGAKAYIKKPFEVPD